VATRELEQTSVAWFSDYLSGRLRRPDFPWQLAGTPHQLRVWEALAAIAPGDTATYGELAAEIGSGARAVAAACRANPLPLLFPCHRIVARNGLGGFLGASDGAPLVLKRWLLEHERRG
jgi:methylated-DNA-[protein]-cysteine S-methyltransferase